MNRILSSGAEREKQLLIRAGQVLSNLHIHSELSSMDVEILSRLGNSSIYRMRKGEIQSLAVNYNRLMECYFHHAGAELEIIRMLELLPECLEKQLCLVVSLMESGEESGLPEEQYVVRWKK
ncbi:MAG: hypothetical protein LIP08_10695 [Bacteroides sp.]|nr:hypothetical protein [Bacteroides sp.]